MSALTQGNPCSRAICRPLSHLSIVSVEFFQNFSTQPLTNSILPFAGRSRNIGSSALCCRQRLHERVDSGHPALRPAGRYAVQNRSRRFCRPLSHLSGTVALCHRYPRRKCILLMQNREVKAELQTSRRWNRLAQPISRSEYARRFLRGGRLFLWGH